MPVVGRAGLSGRANRHKNSDNLFLLATQEATRQNNKSSPSLRQGMAQKPPPATGTSPEARNKEKLADLATYEEQIQKTGFVLENDIARQLKNAGWTVISNRYYVDDAEEKVREIDLVAYRSTKVQSVRVYTSLIISCKKDKDSAWALIARDLDPKDPNSDWWPLHSWTNDKAIEYELSQ